MLEACHQPALLITAPGFKKKTIGVNPISTHQQCVVQPSQPQVLHVLTTRVGGWFFYNSFTDKSGLSPTLTVAGCMFFVMDGQMVMDCKLLLFLLFRKPIP